MATKSTGTQAPITLLENQTVDTDGTQDIAVLYPKLSLSRVVAAEGTFDGATVKLMVQVKDEWVSAGDESEFTEAGAALLAVPRKLVVRGEVTDAGGSTDVTLIV